MKKILSFLTTILVVTITLITLMAQKLPDNRKFYYAFNEKIFIDEIPNKFVIKFKGKHRLMKLNLF